MNKVQMGQSIKQIRMKKGLTQEEFGELVDNATKSMVSKWERGDTSPSSKRQKIIFEIADEVGVTFFNINNSKDLRKLIEREFRHVYSEYLQIQTKELGDRFKRVVKDIDKEIIKEESVRYALSQDINSSTVTNNDIEEILYDFLDDTLTEILRDYPSDDLEILNDIKEKIMEIEEKLVSYYFNEENEQYVIAGLHLEKYRKMKSILEFTVFQLEKLNDE